MSASTNNQPGVKADCSTTTAGKWYDGYLSLTLLRKNSLNLLSTGIALSCYWLLTATAAVAGNFSFTKIADTTSSQFTSTFYGAAINDNGTVAFIAAPNSPDLNFFPLQGIYTSSNGATTEIINPNQILSLYNVQSTAPMGFVYSLPNLAINNNGTIAFVTDQSGGVVQTANFQVILAQGQSLTSRGSLSFPNTSLGYSPFIAIALNDKDEVAYLFTQGTARVGTTGYTAILAKPNQPNITIATGYTQYSGSATPPLSDDPLGTIKDVALDNNSQVTFAATKLSGNPAVILSSDGSQTTNVLQADASGLGVNDNGLVLFSNNNVVQLFNRVNGQLNTIADTNSGSLKGFSTPTINNNGKVAFTATLNTGEKGIFTGADPVQNKVIATGDYLAGSTVTNLKFLRSGLNKNGQIVFCVELADGSQSIFRADPQQVEIPPESPPPAQNAFQLSRIVDTNTQVPGGNSNFINLTPIAIDGDTIIFSAGYQPQGIYKIRGGVLSIVADSNTPNPGGDWAFSSFDQINVIQDNVGFIGRGTGITAGVYVKRGDAPLSVIADMNTPIPGGTGNFSGFTSEGFDKKNVAFIGFGSSQQEGVYLSRDGNLETVADKNTPVPNSTSNFSGFNNLAIDNSNVAFIGFVSNQNQGIYIKGDAALQVVVDKNTAIPGGTGNFTGFFSFLLDKNNLVFQGSGDSGQQGIYTARNGNLQVIVDNNTPIPGGKGNFSGFSSFSFSDKNVVFRGTGTSQQEGIYISRNGSLEVVADTNTTIPGSTIKFTSGFSNPAVSGENIAFVGSSVNGALGIYAKIGGSLLKVADLSSRIDGKRISSVTLYDRLLFKGNSVVFKATFTDGTSAIMRADLINNK